MTGFASAHGAIAGLRFTWELKSVNGKGLDLRLKLAPGFEAIETQLRDMTAQFFRRGSMQANLQVTSQAPASILKVNESALNAAILIAENLAERLNKPMPDVAALMAMPGVIENTNTANETLTDAETSARHQAVAQCFAVALENLNKARLEEGARLAQILSQQISRLEELTELARAAATHVPQAQLARLSEQMEKLIGTHGLDAQRLHQEAALMAARADISEEVDRLCAHIAAARALMAASEPQGRKFDFLCQEFNREANTLCAKSADSEITRLGLELKSVIDQFREQVQNIE